jgi:hypothetical protein
MSTSTFAPRIGTISLSAIVPEMTIVNRRRKTTKMPAKKANLNMSYLLAPLALIY